MMWKRFIRCCFATFLIAFNEISAQCVRDSVSDCIVYDSTHIKTFDGNVYSFNSGCGYTLVSAPARNLEVNYLKNPSGLEINYKGKTFLIKITANGIIFTRDGEPYSMPQTLNGVTVSKPGSMVIVEIKELGIKIRYDGNTVEVIQNNQNNNLQTNGICGNNDGCDDEDLVTQNGQSTTAWADSWAIDACASSAFTNACANQNLFGRGQRYCNTLFANSQFNGCTAYSNLFMQVCISNYCSCKLPNRNDCMCDMLDAIVRTCQTKNNNVITWRINDLCRVQCVNPDQSYSTCAPNRKQLSCGEEEITNPPLYDCEEGCYCPAGMRFFDGKCLFLDECPCLYGGVYYSPGATIAQECNTCTCSQGAWSCTVKDCDIAIVVGDPHYITFDNRRYDFMGKCSYYVVRGIGFDIICDHYVRNARGVFVKNFQSAAPSYCAKVIINVEGDTIELFQNHVVHVNGQRIPRIPFKIHGTRVKRDSSEFTSVILRNRVQIRWSGLFKTIVSIPANMTRRVRGLLGTYTKNPSDDFTMPDGTLAPNANVFGHSWKVPGSCTNEYTDPVDHPCDVNPSTRPTAEQACSYIYSLFDGCSDDPDGDYLDCVYDGCYCLNDDATCLCDFYAQQGEKCARKGINIDWRTSFPQCAITCPAGQTYQTCGNSCTRTCADISEDPTCQTQCIDGCNCAAGHTLNEQDQCIPIAQCPCVHNGIRYPASFTFIDIENDNKHVCQNAVWIITTATPQDIIDYPSLDSLLGTCNANDFLVYSGCRRTNSITCSNKHLDEAADYTNCAAGCECAGGFVKDTVLDMCVRPEDCPCIYKGISYPDDTVISNRDEVCSCVLGFWECVPQTNHWEKCSVWGDVHVRTFDATVYSFEGFCEYVLFEHVLGTGVFRVTVETSSCSTGSCIAALYIHYRAANGLVENIIFITGQNIMAPANLQNLIISNFDVSTMVDVVGLGIRVIWNKSGWAHIHVSQDWLTLNNFGLCGIYDNNSSNDLEVPSVTINGVADFVDYYKLDRICAGCTSISAVDMLLPNDPCNYLLSDVFKVCHFLVPVDDYFNACIINSQKQLDVPPAETFNYYCESIAAYAQECNDAGSPVDWRTATICPFECPANTQYYPCDTPCPKENCDNTDGFPTLCQDKVCAEACNTPECPAGQIYEDGTNAQCILPEDCSPI